MRNTELLRQRIKRLESEKRELAAANKVLEEEVVDLRQTLSARELELALLIKRFFGPKSERYLENPEQLKLDFGDSDQIEDAIDGIHQAQVEQEVEGYTRRSRKPRREKLPEHLPREIETIDLPEDEKQGLECIGYDSTETLKYKPGELSILETRYLKYANPDDATDGVQQAPRQQGLVAGNRYDTSVAAQIIAAKYSYHLPVYRQQDIFAGCGWIPSRSTLLNIMTAAAELLRPLIAYFADTVRGDPVIGTDDTGVTLLLPATIPKVDPSDPKSLRVHEVLSDAIRQGKPSVKAKMWAYRGVHVPLNVFDFTVSRHRDGPDLFLIDNNYQGTLLGDCYGANVGISLRSSGSIAHAACVAHARRKVRDARDNHSHHARVLLSMFRELYDLEDLAKSMDEEGRRELRQQESLAIWTRMRSYLAERTANVLPREAMAQAIGYLTNQWDALTLHLTDGAIPIDNNETEQLMKQVAIGRKNWLFAGSISAGYRAADLMTLTSSAIRNHLDVWSYVDGVLSALLDGSTDYAALRPDTWATAHPEHVRHYREKEKQDRSDATKRRRQRRRAMMNK